MILLIVDGKGQRGAVASTPSTQSFPVRCPMPVVICPACGRHIHLPDEEMSLPSIQCARCDNHFRPATGEVSPRGQTAVALPDTASPPTRVPMVPHLLHAPVPPLPVAQAIPDQEDDGPIIRPPVRRRVWPLV